MVAALRSASPPWHSILFACMTVAACLYCFPSLEATPETFARRLFDVRLEHLAVIRLAFGALIVFITIEAILGEGGIHTTAYLESSRLIRTPKRVTRFKTLFFFTSWAWNLLGIYFLSSGWIAWQLSRGSTNVSPLLLRTTLAAWELAAPFSFLVTTIVRYAIWPVVLKKTRDTSVLRSARTLIMHNGNVLMVLVESALLGAPPVYLSHVALSLLIASAYVVFAWCTTHMWTTPDKGPQFIYFFLDTTLPGYLSTWFLFILFLVLLFFYVLFCSFETVLNSLESTGIVGHTLFILLVSTCMMRWRD